MINQKTILVVDDDEAILDSIKLILEDEGYNVDTASDGKTMQVYIEKKTPDLIILDYRLPGMNGTELTKLLKKESTTKDIPLIMVSSHDVNILARDVGASDFFEKPFDIQTLLSLVQKHLPN